MNDLGMRGVPEAWSPPVDRARGRASTWTAVVLLAGLTIAARLPAVAHPRAINDESYYLVGATELLRGGVLYHDVVDRKPPLLYWTYAAVLAVGGPSPLATIHLACVAWVLLTMAGLYRIGRAIDGPATGVAAALLYSVYTTFGVYKNLAWNGELMMNLPLVWAAALILPPRGERAAARAFGAGALLAAAFLTKQPAGVTVVPLGLVLLLGAGTWRRGIGQAAISAAGFLAAIGLVAAVLAGQGNLADAWYWTVVDHDTLHGLHTAYFWIAGLTNTAYFAACCTVLLALCWRSARDRAGCWTGQAATRYCLLGLAAAATVGAVWSGRFFLHYYLQIVPWLCLLGAPALARLWDGRSVRWWRLSARPVVVGALAVTTLAFTAYNTIGLRRVARPDALARHVSEHTAADDRIFVWGHKTWFYVDSGRRPASRYIATFPLTGFIFGTPPGANPDTSHRIVPGAWDNLGRDLCEHPPEFILDAESVQRVPRYPPSRFPLMRRILEAAYRPEAWGAEGILHERVAPLPGCPDSPGPRRTDKSSI